MHASLARGCRKRAAKCPGFPQLKQVILRRLEQKGYLRHEEKGRAYVYRAVEPARSLAARAVRQIIDSFCQGSVEELVSGMVEAKVLSKGELDSLEEFVRNRKGGK